MRPERSEGCPQLDSALEKVPDHLATLFGPYEQRLGYKSWKVSGRRENWLQWNDGGTLLPVRFGDSKGVAHTWKIFARFGAQPRRPWLKPAVYAHDLKWMLGGADVWGCSCESLSQFLRTGADVEAELVRSLESAQSYVVEHYRVRPRVDP